MFKAKTRIRKAGLYFWMPVFLLAVSTPMLARGKTTANLSGKIKGNVLDYDKQKPLSHVSVSISGTSWAALTDALGSYELPEVPSGYYVLTFERDGYYTDTRTDVRVRPGRATFVNVEMVAVRLINEERRVTANYFPSEPEKQGSQMQFNAEELRRDAGSAGDVSRALYEVPGIVKADEEANDLIVRGGSPVENGFYVDNIFVPNINHFPQWGASGGNINMLNMHFIDSLNIATGGFDASYGNRLSSIVEIGYREGNREKLAGQINLGIIGGGGQVEGPFAQKKGSFMLSAYRSYLDLIAGFIDTGNPSDYYDVQGKIVYDFNEANRLSFLTINGHSETKEDPEFEKESGIKNYSWERFNTSTAGLTWRHIWGSQGFSDTSISYSFMKAKDDGWYVSNNETAYLFSYDNHWITFRNVNQLQWGTAHQFFFGAEAQHVSFQSLNFDDEEKIKLNGTFASVFGTYVVYPFENFFLSAGLRFDYFPLSERTHLAPRLSFSWVLTKRLSVNGSYGMFYQQMPLFLLRQHPDNINLKDMRARHLILGFRYLLFPDTQLILEAYDKQYDNFPMSAYAPYFFVIDDISGDDAMFSSWGSLLDIGKAYARGVELTLQKKLAKNLYGLVSLTYFRSKYRDLMGNWRNRTYDNRFIVALSGGYRPNKYWDFNLRWTLMGGRAFSPVDEEKSIQYGIPWYTYDDIMSGHLSPYKNLSFRVERRFYFNKSNLNIYIGAWNVLDFDNELERFWDLYSNQYASDYMWGGIPFLGFEFEF
ncbi:MAG: TonB-dependent receptor [Candidatus Aminicenantes bacterium]|nr:TonB-dependent receptor [Candidatus Aminicenantes bacterium]